MIDHDGVNIVLFLSETWRPVCLNFFPHHFWAHGTAAALTFTFPPVFRKALLEMQDYLLNTVDFPADCCDASIDDCN